MPAAVLGGLSSKLSGHDHILYVASTVDMVLMTLKAAGKSFVNTVLYSCLCVTLCTQYFM